MILTNGTMVGMLGFGLIQQLILGEPYGDKSMSDMGLVLISLTTFAIMGFVTWLIFSATLHVEVHDRAIYYRFSPFIGRNRRIGMEEIEQWNVGKYNPIADFGGYGYRKSLSGKTAYNIRGNKGLHIKLKTGKELLLGTQKPDELRKAIEHEWEKFKDPEY